jgi:DNA polymerase-1
MAAERLFLLDGMALAYRAYFAFISRPLINSKGENTSAIYGFVTALMKILQEERPEYIAVVFDTREPTFRHRMYSAYKATRQKMPEGMAGQMDKLKEVVRAFNTPLLELPGYEADDIIGTIARRAEKDGIATFMVTGDKDFMQLISPLIKMYKPGKSGGEPEVIGEEEVAAKFGVTPDRVIEVLGLTGDTSTMFRGSGIGEKTAIPLIRQYGSIPELYNNIDSIPQKGIREKLLTHRESAFTSRQLVTIQTDVPIAVEIRELRASRERREELRRLFRELEFRTLVDRLNIAVPEQAMEQEVGAAPDETTNIRTDQHSHKVITSESEFETLVAKLGSSTEFVVNTLITAHDPLRAEILGLAFCLKPRESYFIPLHQGAGITSDQVLKTIRPVLENPRVEKIGHNIKRDILVLKHHGIDLHPIGFDTMVASYVLRPTLRKVLLPSQWNT